MTPAVSVPLRLLLRERRIAVRFAIASIARGLLSSAGILLVRALLAGVVGEPHGVAARLALHAGPKETLWLLAAVLGATQLGAALLAYDAQITEQRLATVVELRMMERAIRHLLGLSVAFFDRHTHGDLIESLRRDVTNVRTATLATATVGLETVQAIGLAGAAVWISPWLACWAFLLVPLAAWPLLVASRRTLAGAFGVRRRSVVIFNRVLQLLHGIRIIKIYQCEQVEADRTIDRARRYLDDLESLERLRARARVALDTLGALGLLVVIVIGGLRVMEGALGWPALLAFLIAARAVQTPIGNVNNALLDLQRHGASVAHLETLFAESPAVRDRPDARPLATPPGRVSAERLSFSYGGVDALTDVTFSVGAGETLGVVGPSGAGKTTLLSLIARCYDPTAGAIRLDDQDARDLRLADVHGAMALVPQDPFLFAASIEENIRCGRPDATREDIVAAARAADVHDDIAALPAGYGTLVGHGGRALSRGEAQRLNLARAILKNAPILLLDEPTSSLDPEAEARVQRALDRLIPGRIAIVVAHRLRTIRRASQILVLSEGRVAGLGPHARLLDDCPTYRRLWAAQTDDVAVPTA